MRCNRLALLPIAGVLFGLSGAAVAQTQIKPRVLVIVDTSGSMTNEIFSNADTGADGSTSLKTPWGVNSSTYAPGYSVNACGTAPYHGVDSRLYNAKAAVSNVVNGSGDVDWGLGRYAGDYCDISTTPVDDSLAILQRCDHTDNANPCGNRCTNNDLCRCSTANPCATAGFQCFDFGNPLGLLCATQPACTSSTQCAATRTCTGGRCTCGSDHDCHKDEFCVGGKCNYDPNLCFPGAYAASDGRLSDSGSHVCSNKVSLPTTYAGSCGTSGAVASLSTAGCESLYTCQANNECAAGRSCAAIPNGVVPNSGATACTCSTAADCTTNLPAAADGVKHVGFVCSAAGFCTYTPASCIGSGAVLVVDPVTPSPPTVLKWLDGVEDYNYTGTGALPKAFLPTGASNVVNPELRAVGGTPLGGSLRSAADWYKNIKTAASDAQMTCRPYITVLMTDGADTCDGGNGSNERRWGPPAAARKFVEETISAARVPNRVYVIGLSITDTSDVASLNSIAAAGGTTEARFANSQSDIEAALADILAESILFEKCNGIDDNCDGRIDEGFGVFKECTKAADCGGQACNAGRCTCTNVSQCGAGYVCQKPSLPQSELVGATNFCIATCTAGVGSCSATGVRECEFQIVGGVHQPTTNQAHCSATAGAPGNENTTPCNKLDDNCNGIVDDCTAGSPDSCSCTSVCVPSPEICNGKDDDCVLGADNSPIDVGLDCGVGACKGKTVCTGGSLSCNGPAPGPVELCNGIDDDCDGITDSFTEACPPMTGQCNPGVRTCTNNMYTACTGIVNGTPELCNKLDDDCDGIPDNNLTKGNVPWLGDACCPTGNNADCCSLGAFVCKDGVQTCDGAVVKGIEVCDGKDNDCNGTADDIGEIGNVCTTDGVVVGGTCTAAYVCTGTPGDGPKGLTCQQVIGPTPEVCNGKDDDCNGVPDDNITSATDPRVGVVGGDPCMALPASADQLPCMPGVTACDPLGNIVCQGYVGPQMNLCDGISRDCTGKPNTAGNCPSGFECFQGNCVTACGAGEFPCLGGFVCDPTTKLCIPDVCNKANCAPGLICEIASDGTAQCIDPCANANCGEGTKCSQGVCIPDNCKTEGCPDGQLCQGTPPECVADPCANVTCDANEYCGPDGTCVRVCENVCLDGTVCINGTCQIDPCSNKDCNAGQICIVQAGIGTCVESFCGNDCGSSAGRVCCGGTCRPDPCEQLQCPSDTACSLDPSCSPQCVTGGTGGGVTAVKIVGAGGGGAGCSATGSENISDVGLAMLLACFALGGIRRRALRRSRITSEGVN